MTKKGEGALLRSRNLDDQTYAQIVEAAEGRLPWLCPEWTDHNAHDPGITVLELLAWYKELQQYHMERAIDALPSAVDYEYAEGELLRTLASWVCVNPVTKADQLRDRIRTALPDYENRFTVEGVRRSVRRLTGKDPILIEHFTVSPNRPDCGNPQLYRRLYGENPYRFFVLLPEGTFASQQARQTFLGEMERLIPAGMSVQLIELKQCVQLDWHTYLGINSRVGGYVPAVIDEQVTIQNDTTIGGASHE